jgi:hypothetical protein
MNPHTATLTEIRDWLARSRKYTEHCRQDGYNSAWYWMKDGEEVPHPFPPTLDGAASAMPEGWWWSRMVQIDLTHWWFAQDVNHRNTQFTPDTGDEITDRYRLAALCVQAEKENKQ